MAWKPSERAVELLSRAAEKPPVLETLFENSDVKIERVTAHGQITPDGDFPDEPSHEFLVLLKGQLVLEYQDETESAKLGPGDFAIADADQRTRADYTSVDEETVWIKVSFAGKPGEYPLFTGAVSSDEVRLDPER